MPNIPGETTVPVADWTTGTLKIYLDTRIDYERQVSDERDQRYAERWKAQEEATRNLKEYSNEYRGSLNDLSTKMATKTEVITAVQAVVDKIEAQDKVNTEFRSRLDVGNPDVRSLQTAQATQLGSRLSTDKLIAYLIAAGSLAIAFFK